MNLTPIGLAVFSLAIGGALLITAMQETPREKCELIYDCINKGAIETAHNNPILYWIGISCIPLCLGMMLLSGMQDKQEGEN